MSCYKIPYKTDVGFLWYFHKNVFWYKTQAFSTHNQKSIMIRTTGYDLVYMRIKPVWVLFKM